MAGPNTVHEYLLMATSFKLQASGYLGQAASVGRETASRKQQAWQDLRYKILWDMSSRTLKPIFQRGGSRRQEILDQAVEMLASRRGCTQQDKMHFCMTNLGMDDTEYLECLNRASNGGLVKAALWN